MNLETLQRTYEEIAIRGLEHNIRPDETHYHSNVEFVRQRFREGVELASYFADKYPGRELRILDFGSGNGGVAAGLSAAGNVRMTAVDIVINPELMELRRRTRCAVEQVDSAGDRLPFRDETFDAVLCLETIEHLPEARAAGREMMRVVKDGGQVMITTPARLRFLFKPDPHYAVRGLLCWPDSMQRKIVVEKLRRSASYDVQHIFWTAGGIMRMFPHRKRVDVLVAIPWPGRPRNLKEILWKIFRRLLWDRIVIWK